MSQKLINLINQKTFGKNIPKVIRTDRKIINLSVTPAKSALDQLLLRNLKVQNFSGKPSVIIQLDRNLIEIGNFIERSEDIENYVKSLLENDKLTLKLEVEGLIKEGAFGGIFRWFPSKSNLLLIALYIVDAKRLKNRNLPKSKFPVKIDEGEGGYNSNKVNFGRLLHSIIEGIWSSQKEKLDSDYKRFLDRAFRPFSDFLKFERVSIKDPRFRPKCQYVKWEKKQGDDRGFLQVRDPPRQLTEGSNQISTKDENGKNYPSVRVADYDDSDQIIIIDEGSKLKDWPEEGVLFLEGDLASNRRKAQAVALLKNRKDPIYAKLADSLIRPWGLPLIGSEVRSYFHNNISHENPISRAQASAVDLALSNKDISLIHGPPGTGKTTVIVEIILHVIKNKGKVLMVAPTHVAVDNVLERVNDDPGINAIRVGGRQYMSNNLQKYRLQNKINSLKKTMPAFKKKNKGANKILKLQEDFLRKMDKKDYRFFENLVLKQSNLVCGTTIGIARYYENNQDDQIDFDLLIMDEASKATVMELLVPAVRAKKWVLVGDHRQLPPYVNDQELRIYIQRYFEAIGENESALSGNLVEDTSIIPEGSNSTEQNNEREFHDKTSELIGSLRRYHEELHALGEGNPENHWQKIVEIMKYNRRPIKSIEEMVNLALGSCFHYFLQRVDETRNVYLKVQHRMPLLLSNFLNEVIYSGNLETSDTAAKHGLTLPKVEKLKIGKQNKPFVFLSTEKYPYSNENRGKRKGYYNKVEANVIENLVESWSKIDAKKLGYTEDNPMTIGVITYYADQSRVIMHRLRPLKGLKYLGGWRFETQNKLIRIRVSIVDRFQGQEQDIVILSLTRCNNYSNIGFLSNLQRINVSLSRAKHNLVVLGNHKFFYFLKSGGNKPIILRHLAMYCQRKKLLSLLPRPEKDTQNKS